MIHGMNAFLSKLSLAGWLVCITVLAFPALSPAQSRSGMDTRLHLGGRYHTVSTVLPFLPFDDGDFSATVGVEFKDASGVWQFLLNGMENPGDDESTVNRILTPQINLLLQDGNFLAGMGVLRSYIRDEETGSDWTRFYYQLKIGLEFQLSDRFDLSGFAIYPFRRWDKMTDFKFADLEYSAGLTFRF